MHTRLALKQVVTRACVY